MANEYKAFYLKDLLPLIDKVAIDMMVPPHTPSTPNSSGMWTEANAHIAAYNNGIRNLAIKLREMLPGGGESDD